MCVCVCVCVVCVCVERPKTRTEEGLIRVIINMLHRDSSSCWNAADRAFGNERSKVTKAGGLTGPVSVYRAAAATTCGTSRFCARPHAVFAALAIAPALFSAPPAWPPAPSSPLRVATHASWSNARNTMAHLWLLSRVFHAATGRVLVPVEPFWLPDWMQQPIADVILFGPYTESPRARAAAARFRRSALTLFFASEFVMGENNGYGDMMVPDVAVSLGHRRDIDAENYLRMPWWLPDVLDPDAEGLEILPALIQPGPAPEEWRARSGFAALLASHASFPRPELFALMTRLGGLVRAPGRAFHNWEWPADLHDQGNTPNEGGGKVAFLKDVRFTICPENSRSPSGGYATEKLVHAMLAGTVPVYWGDAAIADASFFNFDRILLFDGASNRSIVETVRRLEDDAAFRSKYLAQPLLAPTAREWLRNWTAAAVKLVAAAHRRSGVYEGRP